VVEHQHGKLGVPGSNPGDGSIFGVSGTPIGSGVEYSLLASKLLVKLVQLGLGVVCHLEL
jgi:hypothetical protein